MIYNVLLGASSASGVGMGSAGKKIETFLPGRSTYVFDIFEDSNEDIPSLVIRSREDCPPLPNEMLGTISEEIYSMVERRLSKLSTYGGGKKLRKKKRGASGDETNGDADNGGGEEGEEGEEEDRNPRERQGEAMIASAKPHVDIFANVGAYVPSYVRKEASGSSSNSQSHGPSLSTKDIISSSIMSKYAPKTGSATVVKKTISTDNDLNGFGGDDGAEPPSKKPKL